MGRPNGDAEASYAFRVTVRLDPEVGFRGEVGNDAHARRLAEDALSVPVEAVCLSELQTSEAYLDELKSAIDDDLGRFKYPHRQKGFTLNATSSDSDGSRLRLLAVRS